MWNSQKTFYKTFCNNRSDAPHCSLRKSIKTIAGTFPISILGSPIQYQALLGGASFKLPKEREIITQSPSLRLLGSRLTSLTCESSVTTTIQWIGQTGGGGNSLSAPMVTLVLLTAAFTPAPLSLGQTLYRLRLENPSTSSSFKINRHN